MKFDIQKFARDAEDVAYRGNRRLSGNWGRVWLDGVLIFEASAFEANVTYDREDIFIGQSKDSKIVSLTGEGTITIKKVFNRGYDSYLENIKAGHDIRYTLVAAISDPDAVKGGVERIKIENVWFNNMNALHYTKGEAVEDELEFGFTVEDLTYLSTIEL